MGVRQRHLSTILICRPGLCCPSLCFKHWFCHRLVLQFVYKPGVYSVPVSCVTVDIHASAKNVNILSLIWGLASSVGRATQLSINPGARLDANPWATGSIPNQRGFFGPPVHPAVMGSWSLQTKRSKVGGESNGKLPHKAVCLKIWDSTSWIPNDRVWITLFYLFSLRLSKSIFNFDIVDLHLIFNLCE